MYRVRMIMSKIRWTRSVRLAQPSGRRRAAKESAARTDVARPVDTGRAGWKQVPGVTNVWHSIDADDRAAIHRIAHIQATDQPPIGGRAAPGPCHASAAPHA